MVVPCESCHGGVLVAQAPDFDVVQYFFDFLQVVLETYSKQARLLNIIGVPFGNEDTHSCTSLPSPDAKINT